MIGPLPKRPTTVAHRAGNDLDLTAMADRWDMIELDVHVHRGRVEVRHAKVFRPTSRLWEQWYLLARDTEVPSLAEVLQVVGVERPLLVDLKCFTSRAARRILAAIPPDQPLIVAGRSWWVLKAAGDRPGTRVLRSCANRAQVWLAQRLPGLDERTGVTVHARLLDQATVGRLRARTPLVYTWGFTSRRQAEELASMGVTGLIADDPAWVL